MISTVAAGGGLWRDGDASPARAILAETRAVLLDWDGCVAFGDKPHPAALQFIRERRDAVAIVSNNSTHLPEDFAQILGRTGVQIAPDRIILAGVEALSRARETGARRVLVLGDSRLKAHARNFGLNIVQDKAELVVLLRDTRFSFAKLERAANCLKDGARLIVANPDFSHPGYGGRVVPETGALLAALQACAGDFDAEVVGKPGPRLFERACLVLKVNPSSAVMIGDNPATDIAGADAFGLASILIGPGSGFGFAELLHNPPGPPGRFRTA